ncbi:CYTH domain-containing protein [Actinacidiphila yeochonensis]|uniref:hypothetical protein n=1 Tax=Actinacidiphila yeochonensis TaxID=89050 RepID=UPI001E5EDFD0|nr:hypothetical protein [Actinacidiphila yeochonensis]
MDARDDAPGPAGGGGVPGNGSAGCEGPVAEGRYARVERERRFLMGRAPEPAAAVTVRSITDRYLDGTRLRLRYVQHLDGRREFKLTQKIPAGRPGPVQGLITNTYLSADEYRVLAALPGALLAKRRWSVPPLGVDVFEGALRGLVLAEVEFADDVEAAAFTPPPGSVAEVTDDQRFTGGRLVRTARPELLRWMAGFGLDADTAAR